MINTKKKLGAFLLALMTVLPLFAFVTMIETKAALQGSGTADDPYQITNISELKEINNGNDKHYILMNDLDFNGTGFVIGDDNRTWFSGSFDGNGHVIKNFSLNNPGKGAYIGLFNVADGATIKNLGFENATVSGMQIVGVLAGQVINTKIENCYSINGIVTLTSGGNGGGLCGIISDNSTVKRCFTTGTVSVGKRNDGGGIVGHVFADSEIHDSYSSCNVSGLSCIGGVAGRLTNSYMYNCYGTGEINASTNVGSVSGQNNGASKVINSVGISTSVIASQNEEYARIATPHYTAPGNYSNCLAYEDMEVIWRGNQIDIKSTNPSADSPHGQNTTIEELQTQSTYEALGWDFDNVWIMEELPKLRMTGSSSIPDPVPADSVSIVPEALELAITEEYQLAATVAPSNATNKNVTWFSSDDSIATVDSSGKVTAVAEGQATITVTTEDGGHTANCQVTVKSSGTVEPTIIINDTVTGTGNNQIEYVGSWFHQTQHGNYMDDEHVTFTPGDYFQVRFNGTGIKWHSAYAHDRAIVAVYLDGELIKRVDPYSEDYQPSAVLFDSGVLPKGDHILKVVLTEDKNPAATFHYVTVDKIEIVTDDTDPVITALNDADERIAYSGSWNYTNPKAGSYQNDDHATRSKGDSFEITFTGTNIKWYGMKASNCGMAEIYLDGELIETVDCYDAERLMQQLLFDSGTLEDGEHTLKVVVSGERHPASSNNYIILDKLEITK